MLHSIESNGNEAPLCVSLIHTLWSVGFCYKFYRKKFLIEGFTMIKSKPKLTITQKCHISFVLYFFFFEAWSPMAK